MCITIEEIIETLKKENFFINPYQNTFEQACALVKDYLVANHFEYTKPWLAMSPAKRFEFIQELTRRE